MFDKILIANRGEIACRVIRTARKMGVRTVAVFSEADADALHVQLADEAVHIGGSAPAESYLAIEKVIAAAKQTHAQAIHPGYGFLSENAAFCRSCADNNLIFIGPPTQAIEAMGSKSAAKKIMSEANVPLLPGYHGADQDPVLLKQSAQDIGYPVLLKAVSGGGGKGMRQVHTPEEFDAALAAAQREALSGFGDADMLVEKYLTQPRHVEVQVFCDSLGGGVYLFERDCSVQRRHQKIIEEAPAPDLPQAIREAMGNAALRAATAVDYVGAGTVEFLLDTTGEFYFMEMNTRLQVEHPVTEMITGQDLVEWQLRIANGEPLPARQQDLMILGHAFEARIYAEDPDNEFLPAAGKLNWLKEPQATDHVRIDTGVVAGDEVGVFYDPMIAKLIVWDEDRPRALQRLSRALKDYQIAGITTNVAFLSRLADHPDFAAAALSTGFIETHQSTLLHQSPEDLSVHLPLIGLYVALTRQAETPSAISPSPWQAKDNWRTNAPALFSERVVINDQEHAISVEVQPGQFIVQWEDQQVAVSGCINVHQEDHCELSVNIDGHRQTMTAHSEPSKADDVVSLFTGEGVIQFSRQKDDLGEDIAHDDGTGFTAPMNGTVVEILVNAGDSVNAGDTLLIMEAMKMEHAIKAPVDGSVSEVFYAKGDLVDGGTDLLAFTPAIAAPDS